MAALTSTSTLCLSCTEERRPQSERNFFGRELERTKKKPDRKPEHVWKLFPKISNVESMWMGNRLIIYKRTKCSIDFVPLLHLSAPPVCLLPLLSSSNIHYPYLSKKEQGHGSHIK
ncbi:hypothetical protein CERZMDRAFT_89810 [Cercospora zeae-maydis SCOH1-5]|uniref:Uncharacterized protein n=1 Tax=Cercospora zeae-maydis SCOH1-5 TaxID=717836 RepID=A0A6A6FVC9_9PEZI|nr:hypothetical protein CERZMDRAFT_89810 [Cercospora zeae-maydis SCOH1-5]